MTIVLKKNLDRQWFEPGSLECKSDFLTTRLLRTVDHEVLYKLHKFALLFHEMLVAYFLFNRKKSGLVIVTEIDISVCDQKMFAFLSQRSQTCEQPNSRHCYPRYGSLSSPRRCHNFIGENGGRIAYPNRHACRVIRAGRLYPPLTRKIPLPMRIGPDMHMPPGQRLPVRVQCYVTLARLQSVMLRYVRGND